MHGNQFLYQICLATFHIYLPYKTISNDASDHINISEKFNCYDAIDYYLQTRTQCFKQFVR
jgi:hypothetical protein